MVVSFDLRLVLVKIEYFFHHKSSPRGSYPLNSKKIPAEALCISNIIEPATRSRTRRPRGAFVGSVSGNRIRPFKPKPSTVRLEKLPEKEGKRSGQCDHIVFASVMPPFAVICTPHLSFFDANRPEPHLCTVAKLNGCRQGNYRWSIIGNRTQARKESRRLVILCDERVLCESKEEEQREKKIKTYPQLYFFYVFYFLFFFFPPQKRTFAYQIREN